MTMVWQRDLRTSARVRPAAREARARARAARRRARSRASGSGCTIQPSATSPATAIIGGPKPARKIARRAVRVRPGVEERRHQRVACRTRRGSRAARPSSHAARSRARRARTRACGRSGRDHVWLKRRSMCGRICVPSPSTKRPREMSCRSFARCAHTIGLRAKAMAIAVRELDARRSSRAASTSGRKGSCGPSKLSTPSKPCSSSAFAAAPDCRRARWPAVRRRSSCRPPSLRPACRASRGATRRLPAAACAARGRPSRPRARRAGP